MDFNYIYNIYNSFFLNITYIWQLKENKTYFKNKNDCYFYIMYTNWNFASIIERIL